MKKALVTYIVLCILFLAPAAAQETMYIPQGGTIYLGNKIPAGIFGYFRNNGNLSMQEDAKLYFLGKIWIHDANGTVTDSTTNLNSKKGGEVVFYQPNPVYGNQGQQLFQPGYVDSTSTGAVFSKLTVDNNNGVLITSDVSVNNSVNFRRGHFYLNNYNFIVGDSNSTGNIFGYDERRYFVTGPNPSGGFLKLPSVLSGGMATFPIGPNNKNYTPVQMVNRGGDNTLFARAFEKVFSNANSGSIVSDSTLQVTWNIGKMVVDNGDIAVTFQHDQNVEDPVFTSNRDHSYISLYGNGKWDKPIFSLDPQTPGNISSSFPINSSMMNTRTLSIKDKPLYITKRVTKGAKSIDIPNVFSPNGDNINDRWNIKGLIDFENCIVEIFNRYGNMIFHSVGYKQPWDGTFRGQPMPVATYYYIINLKPGDKPISGSVTLLR